MTTEQQTRASNSNSDSTGELSSSLASVRPSGRSLRRRFFRNKLALLGLAFLVFITALAIAAEWLPLIPPNEIHSKDRLAAPGELGYLFGSDELGRDIFSRVIWGGRISLAAGVLTSLAALVIGVAIGLAAGYYGGRLDAWLMRFTDVVLAFPIILLAIGIVAALGPSLNNTLIAVSFAGFPLYARVVRGLVLSTREMEYVSAARAIGATNVRIMLRHILPNLFASVLVTFTLDVGEKIILTASLSFLGMGTQPPTADWGTMVAAGRNLIRAAPHMIIVPGTVIFFVVLAFNIVGDALRDALDPRLINR